MLVAQHGIGVTVGIGVEVGGTGVEDGRVGVEVGTGVEVGGIGVVGIGVGGIGEGVGRGSEDNIVSTNVTIPIGETVTSTYFPIAEL